MLTIAEVGQFSDGVLSAGEFVDVPFVVCVPNLNSIFLKANVVGVE